MNENESTPDENTTDNDAAQGTHNSSALQGKQKPELEASKSPKDEERPGGHQNKNRKCMTSFVVWLKRKSRKAGLHDWLMVVFTGALMLVGVGQIMLACGSSKQTEALIKAAQMSAHSAAHNAAAAKSFADTAVFINGGIGDAVGKLQGQIGKMDAARQSAESQSRTFLKQTINSFHVEQRAWLGFDEIKIQASTKMGETVDNSQPSAETRQVIWDMQAVKLTLVNTGKTPATITKIDAWSLGGRQRWDYGLPLSEAFKQKNAIGMSVPFAMKIVNPNQIITGEFGGFTATGTIARMPAIILKVRIDYVDIWNEPGHTSLCINANSRLTNRYEYCPDPTSNEEK